MSTLTPRGEAALARFKRRARLAALAGAVLLGTCGLYRYRHRIAPEARAPGSLPAGAFAALSPDGGAARAPSGDDLGRPLVVAINSWGGYAPGLVANAGQREPSEASLFARVHGVRVRFVHSDDLAQTAASFQGGAVDVTWATADSFALAAPGMASLHPQAFLSFDFSHGGDAIAATAAVRSAADLAGRRVAFAAGSPSQFFLLYVLSNAGLRADAVRGVPVNSADDAARLFETGQVEAAVSWAPAVFNAAHARPGGHILTSTREADHLIADVFLSRREFLAAHPQTMARFVAGWFDGQRRVAADPALGVAALQSGIPHVSREDAEGMLGSARLTDYWENRRFFGVDDGALVTFRTIFANASRVWHDLGQLPAPAQAHSSLSTAPLEAARDAVAAASPPPPPDAPGPEAQAFVAPAPSAAPAPTGGAQ